jgi:ribose 5-phosphate isomerase B
MMRIAVACDHAGFPLKETVINTIHQAGHEALDLGTYNTESVDYPDFAQRACRAILQGQAERAVLMCGSGVGVSIAANKMDGIYASVCHDVYAAHQGVEHDNMNVLCLGGQIIGPALVNEIVRAFLSANFFNEDRYLRRFNKIVDLEGSK